MNNLNFLQKSDDPIGKGYRLIDFGSYWEFHSTKGVLKGSFDQICRYAVRKFGFDLVEFEVAVHEMEKHFHNGAEFDIYKRFMFTFDKELPKAVSS